MIEFIIPGHVQAQERPRFSRQGDHVRTIDAPKSRAYKSVVKYIAWQNKPDKPLEGPLKLTVTFYMVPPQKKRTKPKMALIRANKLLPITKPDLDNLVKGIKDGCSKIIWLDDAQIVDMVLRKVYAEDLQPRAEVKIEVI